MRFGPVPLKELAGSVLAHALELDGRRLAKGHVLTATDVAKITEAGLTQLTVARLDDDDIGEDEAASQLGKALAGPGIVARPAANGRVNLMAEKDGVLVVNGDEIGLLNGVDEALTLATLPSFARLQAGRIIATIKVIPFAVPADVLGRAVDLAKAQPALRLHPFAKMFSALILTRLPHTKTSILDKTARVMGDRLAALGSPPPTVFEVEHEEAAIAEAVGRAVKNDAHLILLAGASASVDRRDALPAGLVAAGGEITNFGLPVDPGNLLFLGKMGSARVVGLPGCARSPATNGVDWVLERIAAGLAPDAADLAAMGLGGLLKDYPARPSPRREDAIAFHPGEDEKVALIMLAAGRSKRMGAKTKMMEPLMAKPLLTHAFEATSDLRLAQRVCVCAREGEVAALAREHGFDIVLNEAGGEGMASSLTLGLAALGANIDAAFVALGDMPLVTADTYRRLARALDPDADRLVARPTIAGHPGHPVLWHRRLFGELEQISGDKGGRDIIAQFADLAIEVPVSDEGVLIDLDTPGAFAEIEKKLGG